MKALQAEGELLKRIKTELAKASRVCFGMALVTRSGLDLLYPSIERFLERGGRASVLFGVDLPSEPRAIEILSRLEEQHSQNFVLRRFQPGRTFFHPKLSIFERQNGAKTAIIGSSNLTGGGLSSNYETNVFVDEPRAVRQFLDYFDEHFQGAHARRVDEDWLDQYRRLWTQRKRVEEQQRRLQREARSLGRPPRNIPTEIKGHVFAFTGKIVDWPRDDRLYPYVERRGGSVAKKAGSMNSAECLVHAEILGGRRSTRKLLKAENAKSRSSPRNNSSRWPESNLNALGTIDHGTVQETALEACFITGFGGPLHLCEARKIQEQGRQGP
jgi:HKD family nuclease